MPEKPIENIENDEFSVRWTGQIIPEESGQYRIGLKASSGGKVYFNNELQFEFSDDHEPKTRYFDKTLTKGEAYDINIEYFNYHTDPQAHLVWAKMNKDLLSPALEAAKKSDVVLLCLGLSPNIEGEEMPILLEGFDKGDRSEISLPKTQITLMKEIQALGKPTVLVLMNGSALAINWADKNIPALLEAWYPGEFGGNAIADVLFGDYNPAGRLPVTFYKSVDDLPDFKSYDMENRTYKYFKGDPLYPFGHGLSFSTFEYSNLMVENKMALREDILLKINVANTGKIDGDEVIQVYISHKNSTNQSPIRSLVDFKRIHFKAGETKTIDFVITPEQYAQLNELGDKVYEAGDVTISVGGRQPNSKDHNNQSSKKDIVTKTITLTE
jgi:beta-glucosidase